MYQSINPIDIILCVCDEDKYVDVKVWDFYDSMFFANAELQTYFFQI